ncbi:2-polyprenyl-3-methyl-6-methoxy-1,4-benzoquinone monooxygenase [Roseateles sp.]|uniref:2-polyprenyl-3-methyl-6-methoxy-1,4-benzoquinone monooxygenase n=1 Tax=Roseateles sp. TaxID=1971397 RepID=UPI0039C8E378
MEFQPPRPARIFSRTDAWISTLDHSLKTLAGVAPMARPAPASAMPDAPLEEPERKLAASLMRVNHVGEVCAQALYRAQALTTRDEALREHLEHAAQEEIDHLAWCAGRLRALNDRPSLLNPLWYGGAFAIGAVAGVVGDKVSLGFVIETERQVEAHLASHLERLPEGDQSSRAIVSQMKEEEARHAEEARALGGVDLPAPVRRLMRLAAKVMTRTAHHL